MARISSLVTVVRGALPALLNLSEIVNKVGPPKQALDLVHLRTSQISGCVGCIHLHAGDLGKSEETDRRLLMVAAWREASYFNDKAGWRHVEIT
jgi:AhpD family alkylhydroperoxidase